jgi:hypothetical protein
LVLILILGAGGVQLQLTALAKIAGFG